MVPFKKDQFEETISTIFTATVTEDSGQYICPPVIVEKDSLQVNNQQLENLDEINNKRSFRRNAVC